VDEINNINSKELLELIDKKEDIQIIDVRIIAGTDLPFEASIFIPFDKLTKNIDKISREKKVIFICDTGANSFFAVKILQQFHNFTNLWNLKGGIDKYKIDNKIDLQ